jgi:hypothetical protein
MGDGEHLVLLCLEGLFYLRQGDSGTDGCFDLVDFGTISFEAEGERNEWPTKKFCVVYLSAKLSPKYPL